MHSLSFIRQFGRCGYNVDVKRNSGKTARRYFVHGRVQGVGFRWFVQRSAAGIGVDGYARNLDDGRVEVYAAGTPEQLNELSGFLRKGPPMADVRGVEEKETATESVSGFQIDG
jgi:acylphosphatase